jgi:hypothetical protein
VAVPNPVPDAPILLTAAEAKLQGELKLEGKNIGFWSGVKDTAQWTVRFDKPGTFDVTLDYALDLRRGTNEFILEIGDQKLSGPLSSTKNWKNYTNLKAGTIAVAAAGTFTVTIRPARKPSGGLMNLRTMTLTPIANK